MSEHRRTGELALQLFEPGVTCIDLDSGTEQENCDIIRNWMQPENTRKYSLKCIERFHKIINYETECENVKQFLSNIL